MNTQEIKNRISDIENELESVRLKRKEKELERKEKELENKVNKLKKQLNSTVVSPGSSGISIGSNIDMPYVENSGTTPPKNNLDKQFSSLERFKENHEFNREIDFKNLSKNLFLGKKERILITNVPITIYGSLSKNKKIISLSVDNDIVKNDILQRKGPKSSYPYMNLETNKDLKMSSSLKSDLLGLKNILCTSSKRKKYPSSKLLGHVILGFDCLENKKMQGTIKVCYIESFISDPKIDLIKENKSMSQNINPITEEDKQKGKMGEKTFNEFINKNKLNIIWANEENDKESGEGYDFITLIKGYKIDVKTAKENGTLQLSRKDLKDSDLFVLYKEMRRSNNKEYVLIGFVERLKIDENEFEKFSNSYYFKDGKKVEIPNKKDVPLSLLTQANVYNELINLLKDK